jgi:hypothetical protein
MLFRSRTFLFRIALIALTAMMANAVMPTASQLVRMSAYGKVFPLGEICSVSAQTKSADPAKAPSSSGMDACAFCTLHADHPVILPPPAADVLAIAAEREAYPFLFYQAPYRLAVWGSASPRGPPALS